MKKEWILSIFLVLAVFAIGAYFYGQLPEKIAVHWNIDGKADGFSEKGFGVFMLPLLMTGMLALFYFLPSIDPLKSNYKEFKKEYDGLVLALIGFFAYIFALSLAYNLGHLFNMSQFMVPGLGILIFYLGGVLSKAKRNWFVGIRTPWTMTNDIVWKKTHEAGAKLFRISGALLIISILLPPYGPLISIGILVVGSLGLVVYSYVLYKKQLSKS
ncbi:DUF1648 domain-containing protein [Candidatus Micrarchaeota archaeon]|nr:DUF1648 domain-containing protein [Candidatus Micrarchaeota archaeon]